MSGWPSASERLRDKIHLPGLDYLIAASMHEVVSIHSTNLNQMRVHLFDQFVPDVVVQ